jgi:hypothetical protein
LENRPGPLSCWSDGNETAFESERYSVGRITQPYIKGRDNVMASKRTERLQIMLSKKELAELDAWRFRGRMPSLSAAARELLRRALNAKDPAAKPRAKR